MKFRNSKTQYWLPVMLALMAVLAIGVANAAIAAQPGGASQTQPPAYASPDQAASAAPAPTTRRPKYEVAERSEAAAKATSVAPQLGPGQPNEHPLIPVLKWAYTGLENVEKIQDYSATLAKRERIGGKLLDYEYMYVKLRQKPFSVYMYFLGPADLKGQEVIFIEGRNNGNMWAHGVGIRNTMFGTVSLPPTGVIAMKNQRYPLTELGILNLTNRLVEVGEKDKNYGECEVFYKGAKINGRVCTCIEVVHPVARRNFLFHLAQIFVDDELNLPIRYASYDWPREKGGKPELMEEYTYLNLKLNNGFTDADFDVKNPHYKFR
jgi:hypothetical protein